MIALEPLSSTRRPAVAGSFYPRGARELADTVEGLLSKEIAAGRLKEPAVLIHEASIAELEQQAAERFAAAEARKAQIEALSDGVTIVHKAGEEGRLFGSVGTADIARACGEAGVEIEKSEVRLPEGPFRVAGDYTVTLHLHSDVDADLKVVIVGEE